MKIIKNLYIMVFLQNREEKMDLKIKYKENESLILISIMSYYAKQIFNGTKLYEFRKSPLKESNLNKPIFVYSAKDDKAVIGSFKIKKIHKGNVNEIMNITGYDKREDGIEILNYFGNKQICYALELYDVQKFQKPLTLQRLRQLNPKIQIPQYYTYIKPDSLLYKELLHLNNQVGRVNEM